MRAVLILAGLAVAGAAHADALSDAVCPAKVQEVRLSLAPADADAYALKRAGLARTAVERRAEDATLSAGFLCGLKETADRSGVAQARGADPHGRFLGAKLSFAFR
jgi:hypothetical protein